MPRKRAAPPAAHVDRAMAGGIQPSGEAMPRPGAPERLRHILVATAGTAAGTPAVRTAAALARVHGAHVRVVSCFQPPIAYPTLGPEAPAAPIALEDRAAADHQLATVRQQLAEVSEECAAWPHSVEAGDPARCISRAAEHEADLVVLGIGRRLPADRRRGDRTAIAVALTSGVPLLAVTHDFTGAPAKVLVAVGLDATAISAARTVRRIFPHAREIHLVHVRAGGRAAGPAVPRVPFDRRLVEQFERVRAALAPSPGVRVESVVLEGEPAPELLAVARHTDIDLIVGGVRGATSQERSLSRNIGLHVLHGAECSVLLVPGIT